MTGLSGAVVEAVGSAVAAAAAAVRPVEEEKFVKGEKRQSREPVTVPIRGEELQRYRVAHKWYIFMCNRALILWFV